MNRSCIRDHLGSETVGHLVTNASRIYYIKCVLCVVCSIGSLRMPMSSYTQYVMIKCRKLE